ncbi:MAG: SDR family oxidoreductase [Rhizomicrobium sp.]|jgi:NAD(P)-dependent dehydrogenase (short-subunit alcohol dehydrogenase family)
MANFDLTGRTALVTGATSGLGRHFAGVLAAAGASVALSGRRAARLEEVRQKIASAGGQCTAVVLDVNDDTRIARAFDEAEAALGPIDILVNNAGMNLPGLVLERSIDEFDAVLKTDLRAPLVVAREAGRRMIARAKGGRIINIGSIGSMRALPGLTAYCIAKAGIAMMTRCLALEWARYEINVNAICPGYIETELNSEWFATDGGRKQISSFPKRRLQSPGDLDGTLLLLASDQSRAITGAIMTVDDAQSL